MPSLLDPDQTSRDALVGRGLLGLPVAPPDDGSVSHADALAALYRDVVASQPKAAAPSLLEQQVMRNPVGTETTSPYASQSVGVPSGPFNPIEAMTPNGPMLGTDVDRAHALVTQGITEYAPTLLGMVGDAPGGKGFTAYHGSPHDFSAFDTSKIGTGEGAQAFGHGLYFAENEGVAKGYRDQLAQPDAPKLDAANYGMSQDAVDKIVASNMRQITNMRGDRGFLQSSLDQLGKSDDPSSRIVRDLYTNLLSQTPGHMYEVNVNADPAHFLDWDRPLSEQSPKVRGMFPIADDGRAILPNGERADPATVRGKSLYRSLAEAQGGSHGDASQALRDAGIPGIRYLDAGSRNTPNLTVIPPQQSYAGRWTVQDPVFRGNSKHFDTEADAQAYVKSQSPPSTYNHVVFDANTIDIIRKYGIAGLLGGTGAVAGTQQQQ